MANTARQAGMENGIFLGVVADDFTGASDVASFLVEAGVGTVLINGVPCKRPRLREGTGAIVVALKTRTEPAYQAVAESMEAFAWLKEMGAAQLYLKYCSTFDSTDKGNIGPVADAVLEAYGLTCTVLCPSLPVNGRTVRAGKLYVNGVLLEESPMKDHPLTPMRESRIDRLMGRQGRYPCVCLTVEEMEGMRRGGQAPGQALGPEGKEAFYIVPDYFEEAHGDLIAELFGDLPFLTGGSGLAGALGRRYMRRKAAASPAASRPGTASTAAESSAAGGLGAACLGAACPSAGRAVLLAGSCSAVTLRQIADYQAKGHPSLRVNLQALGDGRQAADETWRQIEGLKAGQDGGRSGSEGSFGEADGILVYSSASPEELKLGGNQEREEVAARIERIFSELALRARQAGYVRFIVAGGETSGAVAKALGYRSFYIGPAVAPGVPVMIPLDSPDVRLVLKSGNFGQEDFFERALRITGGEQEEA